MKKVRIGLVFAAVALLLSGCGGSSSDSAATSGGASSGEAAADDASVAADDTAAPTGGGILNPGNLPTGGFDLAKLSEDMPDLRGWTVEDYTRTKDFAVDEYYTRKPEGHTLTEDDVTLVRENTGMRDHVVENDEVETLTLSPPAQGVGDESAD